MGSTWLSPSPTTSAEYPAQTAQLGEAKAATETAEAATKTADTRADTAQATAAANVAALDTRGNDLDARSAMRDTRQTHLETREGTATATEAQIASSQIENGTSTVGTDIEPGNYRTAEAVTSMCSWAILRSGSNGGDIVEYDLSRRLPHRDAHQWHQGLIPASTEANPTILAAHADR